MCLSFKGNIFFSVFPLIKSKPSTRVWTTKREHAWTATKEGNVGFSHRLNFLVCLWFWHFYFFMDYHWNIAFQEKKSMFYLKKKLCRCSSDTLWMLSQGSPNLHTAINWQDNRSYCWNSDTYARELSIFVSVMIALYLSTYTISHAYYW